MAEENVPVHDVILVQVLQRQDQLRYVKPRAVLAESALLLQVPKQLAATLVIGDKVKLFLRLERKFEADEEGTFQGALQNLALANGVRDLLLCHNLLFREHLHRIDTASILFAHLENAPKGAAADELEKVKVGRFEVNLVLVVSRYSGCRPEFRVAG
jgi:hypothetical protein